MAFLFIMENFYLLVVLYEALKPITDFRSYLVAMFVPFGKLISNIAKPIQIIYEFFQNNEKLNIWYDFAIFDTNLLHSKILAIRWLNNEMNFECPALESLSYIEIKYGQKLLKVNRASRNLFLDSLPFSAFGIL